MPDWTQLQGVSNYWDPQVSAQLETSVLSFLQWGFLGVGAFNSVTIPTSGVFGGNQHQLRFASDPYFTDGQVWEGFRQDWIWESGINYGTQPIRVSGVYVNGDFFPTASTTGTYQHYIDYPRGRVVFGSAIEPTSVVTCEYSYRQVRCLSSDLPFFQEVQFDSFRVDDSQFHQAGSGAWATLPDNRVQLPALFVEVTPEITLLPLELGSKARRQRQTVNLWVMAENPYERKQLGDILVNQWNMTFYGFDREKADASGVYPLNEFGSPNVSGLQYPDLVAEGAYRWGNIYVNKCRGDSLPERPPLYQSRVQWQCELYLPVQ